MRAQAALLALATLLAGCVSTSTPSATLDPQVLADFSGLTSHAALRERLDALAPLGVLREPIGLSVEGREMELLRVGDGPFELWLAARHHGDEPTSTEAVLNTLAYLLGDRAPPASAFPVTRELYEHRAWLLERLTFVIVPMVNPDGAEAFRRTNSNGQDLNRDYLLYLEPESRNVRDAYWRVWPDAGLDLHNVGFDPEEHGFDFEAYYPEVPRAEDDTQVRSLANQWTTVYELDASGSYAGGPNENYVTSSIDDPCEYSDRFVPDPLPNSVPVPPPTGNTNPTAYCEGTHDAFLTLRGAPGWTPEAAVGDGADSPTLPWGIRQHEATIASTAFFYAGAYAGCEAQVQKFPGTLATQATIPVTTRTDDARFQLVWREDLTGGDQPSDELDLTLRTPSGGLLGPEAHPFGYTETLGSTEAGMHVATLRSANPVPTPYELRVYECVPHGVDVAVERAAEGLRATNRGTAPAMVTVQDSLIGRHALAPDRAEVRVVDGNLAPKTLLSWTFPLAPGETRTLAYALPDGAAAGPARWHAHGPAGEVRLGVTEERGSPSPLPAP